MSWTTQSASLALALVALQEVPRPALPSAAEAASRLEVLRDRVAAAASDGITNEDLGALQELAPLLRVRYDPPDPFFERAAVLHSDIAMSIPEDDPSPVWASMMSPRSGVARAEDGQQQSLPGGIVHGEFGGVLLDAVRESGRDEFVRSWYRRRWPTSSTSKTWIRRISNTRDLSRRTIPRFDFSWRVCTAEDADPWWTYRLVAGRRARALRDAMNRSLTDGWQP